ncbi:MAG: hypothetical protein [Wendovervirus sonii]|uniref:Uncharacterized protein n=1 Tax=phage Lak_Megaphage_Sonny TaxID=3109229 RepID=A0ABZ0Z465_9CAUD|nr:MAG: hypothetical protein [phage Lak_Megaphage_Sonny]
MATKKIEQVTVKQMLKYCQEQIRRGNGDKYLITANDTEGNGYHGVFFGLTPVSELGNDIMNDLLDSQIMDPDQLMCIG